MFLEKVFILISKRNVKIKEAALRIQSEIFKKVKFMTGFITGDSKGFFETLINETGGVVVQKEEEAEFVLTNTKEETKETAITATEKAYCKNFAMQGYLLKKRPPAGHFKTRFI